MVRMPLPTLSSNCCLYIILAAASATSGCASGCCQQRNPQTPRSRPTRGSPSSPDALPQAPSVQLIQMPPHHVADIPHYIHDGLPLSPIRFQVHRGCRLRRRLHAHAAQAVGAAGGEGGRAGGVGGAAAAADALHCHEDAHHVAGQQHGAVSVGGRGFGVE